MMNSGQSPKPRIELQMLKSNFTFEIHDSYIGKIVAIIDEYTDANPTMSVTNDIENVIDYVVSSLQPHVPEYFIYRDTTGQWDEIIVLDGEFKSFSPLRSDFRPAFESVIREY